jgi:hypothetical protein
MSSIFKGYKIWEDPDDKNSLFMIVTPETVLYASLSDLKTSEAFDLLEQLYEDIVLYEVPLDDFLLEGEELDQLNKLIEESQEQND